MRAERHSGFLQEANSPYFTGSEGAQYLVVDNFNGNPSPDLVVVHDTSEVVTMLNTTTA